MITSQKNERIKKVIALKKSSKERKKAGLYIVEGVRICREIPKEDVYETYVSESFSKEKDLGIDIDGATAVSDNVFSAMSDTVTPQGILCVVRQRRQELFQIPDIKIPFTLLVLENIQDPGNMGTMIRTAEAAGVSGIVLGRDCADIYNPKTIRSTMGAVFRMNIYISEDLYADIGILKNCGVTMFAASLDGAVSYETADYNRACAFLIGNEGSGLSQKALDMADEKIYIPMEGRVDSLNASVAAAVLMYEASRQRKSGLGKIDKMP